MILKDFAASFFNWPFNNSVHKQSVYPIVNKRGQVMTLIFEGSDDHGMMRHHLLTQGTRRGLEIHISPPLHPVFDFLEPADCVDMTPSRILMQPVVVSASGGLSNDGDNPYFVVWVTDDLPDSFFNRYTTDLRDAFKNI